MALSPSSPPSDTGTSITRSPEPCLVSANSGGPGRTSRPAARSWIRIEAIRDGLSGAGVMKGGNRQERAAEKVKENKRERAQDGASSSNKLYDRRPDVPSAPTILQCEPKPPHPRPLQQGLPVDTTARQNLQGRVGAEGSGAVNRSGYAGR
jgi:hypothetical protein